MKNHQDSTITSRHWLWLIATLCVVIGSGPMAGQTQDTSWLYYVRYVNNSGRVCRMDPERQGSEQVIYSGRASVTPPLLPSPDGKHILVNLYDKGKRSVGLLPAAGGTMQTLSLPENFGPTCWTEGGRRLFGFGPLGAWMFVNLDGTQAGQYKLPLREATFNKKTGVLVTHAENAIAGVPSPDGKLVAHLIQKRVKFVRSPYGSAWPCDLTLFSSDGKKVPGEMKEILSSESYGEDETFAWSPDGSIIAALPVNRKGLLIYNVGGRTQKLVGGTEVLGQIAGPRFSPDGRRLAFTAAGEDNIRSLQVINVDGTGFRKLGGPARDFTWSPDSKQIVYSENTSGGVGDLPLNLAEVETGAKRMLMNASVVAPVALHSSSGKQ